MNKRKVKENWIDYPEPLRPVLTVFTRNIKRNYAKLSSLIPAVPFMEPGLRSVYTDTALVTLLGLPSVSLIMQGVFLEKLMREVIFFKEGQEPKLKGFWRIIDHCRCKGYIDDEEFNFLNEFRLKIRNLYIHVDISEITKGASLPGIEFIIDMDDMTGSIIKATEELKSTSKRLHGEDHKPVAAILKDTIAERLYLNQFVETTRFAGIIAEKHFISRGESTSQ